MFLSGERWKVLKLYILTNFKSQYESLHIKMYKQSLGLNKYATNLAVLGELCRFPLIISIIQICVKKLKDKFQKKNLDYVNKTGNYIS